LLASPSWKSSLFLGWHAPRILFPSSPMLAFSQERGATSAFRPDAVPPCGAPIILDEGHRLSRNTHGFFRAVRVFLSGLVHSSVALFPHDGQAERNDAGCRTSSLTAEVNGFETAKPVFDTIFLEFENTTEANEESAQ
jgi:hypothetical protein